MESEYRTFVVRITDMEAAREFLDRFGTAFSGGEQIPGLDVTAMSLEDEITRAENLEDELWRRELD